MLGARTLDPRLRGDDNILKNMRTEPPFNIGSPINPYELKPIEKTGRVNNEKKESENLDKEKSSNAKALEDEKKKPLPTNPFNEKGKKIDVVG